ncbi:hypothetical protein HI914_02116 [Erysiphe necator]|nr:hypothetical protein HI914_02116 [Erysiphe necator]
MNRFRRKKEARDAPDGSSRLSIDSDTSVIPTTRKAFRLGKKTLEPEPKSKIDLATALPSSDNFRTSLLMNGLSARFSMLREQDDPNSKLGKASDDSVMFSKRMSRFNDFGLQAQSLSDIAEDSSVHSSLRAPHEIERVVSNASLPCYNINKNSQSNRSIMNRSRPGEGNNLFGGRLKINVGNRVLYDDDVRLSAYQRQRRAEKDRSRPQIGLQGSHITTHAVESSNYNNFNVRVISTHSENCEITPNSATSLEKRGDQKIKPSSDINGSPEGRTCKIRKLYEAGLDNRLHEQQFSAMSKIDTLTRRAAVTGTPSPGPSPLNMSSNLNIWKNPQANAPSYTSLHSSISTKAPTYYNSHKDEFLSPPLTPYDNDEEYVDSCCSNVSYRSPDSETKNFHQSHDKSLNSSGYGQNQDDQNSLKSKNSSSKPLIDVNINHYRNRSNSNHGSKNSDINSVNSGYHNSDRRNCNLSDPSQSSLSLKDSSQNSIATCSFQESPHNSKNPHIDSVDVKLHLLELSDNQSADNINADQFQSHKIICDPSLDFKETELFNKSSRSSNSEKVLGSFGTERGSSNEIIGMVRQHIRYQSNTSSIYESPPSTNRPNLLSQSSSAFLHNDYLAQSNPWKGDYDDEKIVIPIEEPFLRYKNSNEIAKSSKSHVDDEKIVVSSEETNVKTKSDVKNTSSSSSVRYHIGHYFNADVKPSETNPKSKYYDESVDFHDENLYLSSAKYDNGSSYDINETSSVFSDGKEPTFSHSRHDSTDTQREQQDLKTQLASRRLYVQEKMKSFVESDNNLLYPISVHEMPKDGPLKNGVFGMLRTKSSWASVKPPKRLLVSRPC